MDKIKAGNQIPDSWYQTEPYSSKATYIDDHEELRQHINTNNYTFQERRWLLEEYKQTGSVKIFI
jgi:hypothetical protein